VNLFKRHLFPYWTNPNPGPCNPFLPDFQGGLVVESQTATIDTGANTFTVQNQLQKFDGMTGQAYPSFTYGNICPDAIFNGGLGTYNPYVVHPDGTIFTSDSGNLVAINPLTGQAEFSISFATGGAVVTGDQGGMAYLEDSLCIGPAMSTPIVAGDGYAYLAVTPNLVYGDNPPKPIITTSLYLLRLNPSGQGSSITLGQWQTPSAGPNVLPIAANLITNADQGALVSWETVTGIPTADGSVLGATYSNYLTTTSGTSVVSQATTFNLLTPVLQRTDGNFVGTMSASAGTSMAAFNSLGGILWSVPNDTPQIATAYNEVIGISGTTYDASGNATGLFLNLPIQSWTGAAYTLSPFAQVPFQPTIVATPPYWSFATTNQSPAPWSGGPVSGANQSGNGTSPLCHDDRDQFTPEYVTYGAGFVPSCFEFLSASTYASSYPQISQSFLFSVLNQDDMNPKYNEDPNWAILTSSLLNGLEGILASYGPITVTSGYRSPYVQHVIDAANIAAGKSKKSSPQSQHLFGDAADLRATSLQTWQALHNITRYLYPNSCIEPYNQAIDHFHVDWRPWYKCAPSWQK
jgi:hypothetical protein